MIHVYGKSYTTYYIDVNIIYVYRAWYFGRQHVHWLLPTKQL